MATHRLGQVEAYLIVREVLSEASTAADGVLSRERSGFCRCRYATLGFTQGHIAGAVLLDFRSPEFVSGLKRLDRSKNYLIYCRSGNRSGQALKLIDSMGFQRIYHLKHGIIDWQKERLPLVKPSNM